MLDKRSMTYLYLHGFASGPQSTKAVYLRDRFQSQGIHLAIPDLNQGDFFHLTLTRHIQQVTQLLQGTSPPHTIIGSSLGGLTAAWVAQSQPQVEQLILLAPAFGFLCHWLPQLGREQGQQWQQQGQLEVYHYGMGRAVPLSYGFVEDMRQYDSVQLHRAVPTLILHGVGDQTIPIQASRDFAGDRPWVQLRALESDHALTNVLPDIWQAIQSWGLGK